MVHPKLKHIANAGTMGRLIANYDWVLTPVGDPEKWPASLLTTLNIMLQSKIPTYIAWGTELVQFYNDVYISMLGNKHPEALGNTTAVTWAETHDMFRPLLEDVFRGNSFHQENTPYTVLMNGVPCERLFNLSCLPITKEDGSVGGVFVTVIDTTEEFSRKKILEESEKNFRNYQELSPIPFFSINQDWVMDYINPASLKLVRLKREEVIGKYFWDAFIGAKESVFYGYYERAMKGEIVDQEGYYEPYDTWYRIFAYPLSPGVGVIYQDISEAKKLQIELKSAVESRDRFLSIASHELNTPLTTLKLHTQMMQRLKIETLSEEKLKKFFYQSDIQISRLSRLVDDMLDVSRIREGKLSLNFEYQDLKAVLPESIERLALYYQNSHVNLPDITFEGKDFICRVDLQRFEQVINNLLINALKYGEGKPVHMKVSEQNEKIILMVEDHGKGVAEVDQEHIFEQYYRGESTTGVGLGLGLFITKQIIDAHGGKISLKSAPGQGSIFRVELPKHKQKA